MPTNTYFGFDNFGEQRLIEDLTIEALKIYGQDVYYLPRTIVEEDKILNEEIESQFNDSYMIEMYLANVDGFDGNGTLLQKFGLEIKDEVTLVVARRRWEQLVGFFNNDIDQERPYEGDLIYIPYSKTLFEVRFVEHEKPFYQLNDLPVYELQCEMFEYERQDFDTGIEELDNLETLFGDSVSIVPNVTSGEFDLYEKITLTLGDGTIVNADYSDFDILEQSNNDIVFRLTGVEYPDGEFKPIETGATLVGQSSGAIGTVARVIDLGDSDYESASNDPYQSNSQLEDEGSDFIDFSTDNPFGEL
jgi:hypothetical protein